MDIGSAHVPQSSIVAQSPGLSTIGRYSLRTGGQEAALAPEFFFLRAHALFCDFSARGKTLGAQARGERLRCFTTGREWNLTTKAGFSGWRSPGWRA